MSKNKILCIGRPLGSDGRNIGHAAADALGIPCYDRTLLNEVLERTDIPAAHLERYDEKRAPSMLHTLLFQGADQSLYGKDGSEILFELQKRLILEKAAEGPCVFIGRCADAVLHEEETVEVLSLFISAPEQDRVARVAQWKGIPEKEALSLLRKTDKHRKAYYEYHTGNSWGNPANYDLALNSSAWDRQTLVRLITRVYQDF